MNDQRTTPDPDPAESGADLVVDPAEGAAPGWVAPDALPGAGPSAEAGPVEPVEVVEAPAVEKAPRPARRRRGTVTDRARQS